MTTIFRLKFQQVNNYFSPAETREQLNQNVQSKYNIYFDYETKGSDSFEDIIVKFYTGQKHIALGGKPLGQFIFI